MKYDEKNDIIFVYGSPRWIFVALYPLFYGGEEKRGVQREPKTWLKILRCGRKWISDTRNATLFGTITRESPSKPPISIQPLLEIYLLDQKVLTCDLAPTNTRTGWHVSKKKRGSFVIRSFSLRLFVLIPHVLRTCAHTDEYNYN